MSLLVLFLFAVIQNINCLEQNRIVLLSSEKEHKQDKQQLRTGHGLSPFSTVSIPRKTLHQTLITLINNSTGLSIQHCNLVLEYCTLWKQYGKIPAYASYDSSRRRAAFLKYEGQECLLTEGMSMISDFTLNLWNLDNRFLRLETPCQTAGLIDLCVTSDGTKVIFCTRNDIIRVYDTQTFRELRTLPFKFIDNRGNIAVSPDSQLLAAVTTLGMFFVCIWELTTGAKVAEMHKGFVPGTIFKLLFSQDGDTLHVQTIENGIMYDLSWDITTKKVDTILVTRHFIPSVAAYSPDKSLVAYDNSNVISIYDNKDTISIYDNSNAISIYDNKDTISIMDETEKIPLAKIPYKGRRHGSLSFSQSGEYLAAIHEDSGSVLLMHNSYDFVENLQQS